LLGCIALAKLEEASIQKVALDAVPVPVNTNPDIKALPTSPEDGPVVTWLGCLHLKAKDPKSLFGGISGSFMHGSRLFMLSDTTRDGGSGRFFTGDIKMGPSEKLNGELIVPLDLQNVTTQPLRNESGNYLFDDKKNGDTESLGIRWPDSPTSTAKVLIGVERKHKVRIYKVKSPDGPPIQGIGDVTPTTMKGGKHNVGTQLRECTRGEDNEANNFGAEGTAFVSDTEFIVFCEYNKPGADDTVTVGWISDYETGTIKANLELPLPRVPYHGLEHKWMRISSVVEVPGTRDMMFLFHFWGPDCKSIIQIARATLPAADGDRSPKRLDPKVVMGPLRELEGYPIDNFETLNVVPTDTPGAYTIHLLSDNNFKDKYQKTYLLSMLMKDKSEATQLWSTKMERSSSNQHTISIAFAAVLAAAFAMALGVFGRRWTANSREASAVELLELE